MGTKTSARLVAATLALLIGASVLMTAPRAEAAVGNTTCDAGEICLWQDNTYKGCFFDARPQSADGDYTNGTPDWNNCTGTMNDKVTSYKNRSSHWLVVFEDTGYNGIIRYCLEPGASSANFANFGPGATIQDRTSSHQTYTQTGFDIFIRNSYCWRTDKD